MKLSNKRFWIWCIIIVLIPIMMSVFAALILMDINTVSELCNPRYLEVFIIWEVAYLLGGSLTYRGMNDYGWIKGTFLLWGISGVLIVLGSFLWAGIKISDGFSGLAFFMISCISWCFSLLPLLLCVYSYKRKFK